MIIPWMLYCVAVGIACVAAALIAERALLMMRWPTRPSWIGAMLLLAVLSVRAFPRADAAASAVSAVYAIDPAGVSDGRSSNTSGVATTWTSRLGFDLPASVTLPDRIKTDVMDKPTLVLWATLSITWLLALGISAVRIARERTRWTRSHVAGMPVWISHDVGPAVFGVLRYEIVLPSWIERELGDSERALVLSHEREHAHAHDPVVLFAAGVLAAFQPWNPAAWYLLRRLRHAVELDCDARVTARHPDAVAYGRLLVSVGERTLTSVLPTAALSERSTLIERRIRQMIRNKPQWTAARGAALLAMSAACVLVACRAPRVVAGAGGPERGIQDVASVNARRAGLKGILRPARDLPPQGFVVVEADSSATALCIRRMRDPRDGTELLVRTSTTYQDTRDLQDGTRVKSLSGFADYLVFPKGRYGVADKELLRMRCGTNYVLGITPDSVGITSATK